MREGRGGISLERLVDVRRGAMALWSTVAGRSYAARGRIRAPRLAAVTVTSVTSLRVAVWLAGFCLLCFVYFAPHEDANQHARLDMAVTIVDNHTFSIDQYQANTSDKSLFRGHYYILKSPGSSFAGIPTYLLYKASFALRGSDAPANAANDLQLRYLEVVTTVGLPAILFLLLFFWFLGYFSPSLINRTLVTIALGLGTIVLPYTQNFYAHVPVAGLLFAAFVLVYIVGQPGSIRGPWTRRLVAYPEIAAMLAGLTLGAVVVLEYPPALIAGMICWYAWFHIPRRLIGYLAVGAAPPAMVLMAYSYAIYRNPFTLSYTGGGTNQYSGSLYAPGTAGFLFHPIPAALWGMSFSSYRGLFFLSPFLLLAFPGYLLWAKRGGREWLLCLAASIGFFVFISMFVTWDGGWAVGPRYLVPLLPFLALPVIFTLDHISTWRVSRDIAGAVFGAVYLLVAISIVNVWAESISSITPLWPDQADQNVLFHASLPTVLQGGVLSNLGTMYFGLNGASSLFLLLLMLAGWSLIMYMPPLIGWANWRSGWLPVGEQPSWAAWRRRIAIVPSIRGALGRLHRARLWLQAMSSGASPAPALADFERTLAFRPEYALLRQPDAGWRMALWLTLGLRAGLGLVGAWAAIAHAAIPAGAWTDLIIQGGKSWSDVLSSWQRWDALAYQHIAQSGYHAGDGSSHFGPLYPFLVHVLSLVLGTLPVVAELLISSVAFAVAIFMLYCLARLIVGPVTAGVAVLVLAFFPTAFLLLAPYSLGLLLALTLLSFWFAQTGRSWRAGLVGMAAALAHPLGVLIVPALVFEYIQRRRADGTSLGLGAASTMLPVLGPVLFNLYLRTAVGETQLYVPWSGMFGIPGTPVVHRGDPLEIINIICLVGFAGLTLAASRRLPLSYVIYAGVVLSTSALSEIRAPLITMAQTALLLFPCYVVLALWLVRRPSLAAGWITFSVLLQALLLMMWVRFVFLG